MEFSKKLPNGITVETPTITRRAIQYIPKIFEISEWLIAIAAFQFASIKLNSLSLKVVWLGLSFMLALYVGLLTSHI